jgi:carbon monoxide dehydrogenase subunit G
MHLASQQTLPVGQDDAWAALNDTEVLKACIPGCESIVASGPNQYDVAMTAAVGPVKAKFKGKLRLSELKPPTSYSLHFDGQGGPAGHGKGKADVRLEPKGPHETVLHYAASATVGGKIAQVGSRLVDMAAQKMAGEFFAAFDDQLRKRHGIAPAGAPPERRAGLLARIVAWLRRLFGGARKRG